MHTPELQAAFREGFHPSKPAAWVYAPLIDAEGVAPDVGARLAELHAGRRDFSYPGHDPQVLSILQDLVPTQDLKVSADVGCASGALPAMHLYAGIDHVTVYEVRPLHIDNPQVTVRVEDLAYAENAQSEFDLVTCLSTIEHVGLGRYGDPLDPQGDLRMAATLRRIVKPGGFLLLSFPTGRGTVVYNRHRIYNTYRRQQLFGDFKVLEVRSDRSAWRRVLHEGKKLIRPGDRARQPVWLLQRP